MQSKYKQMLRLLAIVLTICTTGGSVLALPWIRDMWTGPVVHPQTEVRMPPEESMATDGERLINRRQARAVPNPLPESASVLAEGETLYATYCALCHGGDGRGNGQLASFYGRMPNLTMPYVLNYPDGFVYSIIREGGRNMPRFADALSVDERWALVHYLGTLEPMPEASR